jgi:excisionase family DNA binding protein
MPETLDVESTPASGYPRRRALHQREIRERRLRPKFISIKEACEYLNCSRSYFYEDLYSKVRKRQLGKRILLELDSVDELADSLPAVG